MTNPLLTDWTTPFGLPPFAEISDDEFITLISVMIAPSELRLDKPNTKRDKRIKRIKRLLQDECAPNGHNDA